MKFVTIFLVITVWLPFGASKYDGGEPHEKPVDLDDESFAGAIKTTSPINFGSSSSTLLGVVIVNEWPQSWTQLHRS